MRGGNAPINIAYRHQYFIYRLTASELPTIPIIKPQKLIMSQRSANKGRLKGQIEKVKFANLKSSKLLMPRKNEVIYGEVYSVNKETIHHENVAPIRP